MSCFVHQKEECIDLNLKKPCVPLLAAQAHNILKSAKNCHARLGKTRHCSFIIEKIVFLIKFNFMLIVYFKTCNFFYFVRYLTLKLSSTSTIIFHNLCVFDKKQTTVLVNFGHIILRTTCNTLLW